MKFGTPYCFSLVSSLVLFGQATAKTVAPSSFAASNTVPVSALLSAADKVNTIPPLAKYPTNIKDHSVTSTMYSDWASFKDGAAYVWKADMDVDCDGLDHGCKGNLDGQSLTNWGALSAYEVPFIVIPNKFLEANQKAIAGNNVAAVICNNKMYYGILGDTNNNDPQVTGEASWLLARTCFPEDDLNGNRGHDKPDVTYILFIGEEAVLPPTAINGNYITDFGKLRSMGDRLANALVSNLGISSKLAPSPNTPGESKPDYPPIDTDTDADTDPGSGSRPIPVPGPGNDTDTSTDTDSGALMKLPRARIELNALFWLFLILVSDLF